MDLKYIVYVTVNLCNGKLYFGVHRTNPKVFDGYIGCGVYRPKQASKQWAFHKAVKKYGYENFRRTIIETFADTEEGKKAAYDLEKRIVTTTLLKSKYVYNTVRGGEDNDNDNLKKRVYKFDMNGNYLRSYKGVIDAAIDINPQNVQSAKSAIKNCCYGVTHSALGFYWSYDKIFLTKEDPECIVKRRRNCIAQYTLSGKFLRYFDNIADARVSTGLKHIHSAIANKGSVGGYQWRFYTGDDSDIAPFESPVTRFRTKPVILIAPDGTKQEYASLKQCIEHNSNLKAKGLQDVLRGVHKTHWGYVCKYKDDDIV